MSCISYSGAAPNVEDLEDLLDMRCTISYSGTGPLTVEDATDTSWSFTISNSDCLSAACSYYAGNGEDVAKQLEAEASRKRDLSYLFTRRPTRLRYRVVVPRIRIVPVLRQRHSTYRCHRRVFRCLSLRRRIVCRSAGLVALRVNAKT